MTESPQKNSLKHISISDLQACQYLKGHTKFSKAKTRGEFNFKSVPFVPPKQESTFITTLNSERLPSSNGDEQIPQSKWFSTLKRFKTDNKGTEPYFTHRLNSRSQSDLGLPVVARYFTNKKSDELQSFLLSPRSINSHLNQQAKSQNRVTISQEGMNTNANNYQSILQNLDSPRIPVESHTPIDQHQLQISTQEPKFLSLNSQPNESASNFRTLKRESSVNSLHQEQQKFSTLSFLQQNQVRLPSSLRQTKKSFHQKLDTFSDNDKGQVLKKRVFTFMDEKKGEQGSPDNFKQLPKSALLNSNKNMKNKMSTSTAINALLSPKINEQLSYRRQLQRQSLNSQKDLQSVQFTETSQFNKHQQTISQHLEKINKYFTQMNDEDEIGDVSQQNTNKLKKIKNTIIGVNKFNQLGKPTHEQKEQREYMRQLDKFSKQYDSNSNIFIKEFFYKLNEFLEMVNSQKRAGSILAQVRGFNNLIRKLIFQEGDDLVREDLCIESLEKDLKIILEKSSKDSQGNTSKNGKTGLGVNSEMKQLQFYYKNLSELIESKQFAHKVSMHSQFITEYSQIQGILDKCILETDYSKQELRGKFFDELVSCGGNNEKTPNFILKNLPLENIKYLEKRYGKCELISQFVREKEHQIANLCKIYQNI